MEAILQERCVLCHSGDAAPLGLRLDSHAGLMAGSENGPVVDTDAPSDSAILRRLRGLDVPQMPLDGPPFLDPDQIATVEAWIEAGAGGPGTAEAPAPEPTDPYADGQVTYDEVAAIFGRHCVECHSPNSRLGAPPEGVRLDGLDRILAGGERLVLIPGNAQASEIIRRVEGIAAPRMPFDGPPWLDDAEVRLLRDWIEGGARNAAGEPAPVPAGERVRIRGILTGPREIDGAAFVVTQSTRLDDRPALGAEAEMRGLIGPDGSIVADRFRAR